MSDTTEEGLGKMAMSKCTIDTKYAIDNWALILIWFFYNYEHIILYFLVLHNVWFIGKVWPSVTCFIM